MYCNFKLLVDFNFWTKGLECELKISITCFQFDLCSSNYILLARPRRPPAAFLLNGAITRGANGTKTFPWTYPNYMQSFIKIRGAVLEKNADKAMTLCNFNKDVRSWFFSSIGRLKIFIYEKVSWNIFHSQAHLFHNSYAKYLSYQAC